MPSGRRSTKRPYGTEHVPIDADRTRGGRTGESAPDGEWTVQQVGGSDRSYRCPGCDQVVAPGTAHLVVWASDGMFGPESALADRRHWHRACWSERARRRPGR